MPTMLDDLQLEVTDLFSSEVASDTFNVLRPGDTGDNYGGTASTFGPNPINATPIPCFYAPLKGGERYTVNQAQQSTIYLFIAPAYWKAAAVDVAAKDRLVLLARGSEPQRTFEIGSVNHNQGLNLEITGTLDG